MNRSGWFGIGIALVATAAAYLLVNSSFDLDFLIPRRALKLAAMIVAGVSVAVSSVLFQTVTRNRVLTPAIMGYEAVFMLFQSLLVLFLGTASLVLLGQYGNFVLSIVLMLAYSQAINVGLFHRRYIEGGQALLFGLTLTLVLASITQFVQLRTSPGEFAIIQGFTLVSFERIEPVQLALSGVVVAAVCVAVWRGLPTFDIVALGREQAISLGVDHRREVQILLALIALLVSISTSLIGPTAFMGVFVANIAYVLARTQQHRATLPLACAIAILMFLVAQFSVEHIFDYRTTVGILINLTCGVWFLTLTLRLKEIA